ncbi:thiolase family protein [Dethiobacter alkaliphilus]|uniref:thiolase family protein n=1 Tax=Dethiobacter alkaliphilus TaxID=427926 RepID=UPI0022263A02|nr:acetyl-CoA C-acyltransferase [Dethiobacter alkaliphilus]MCW3490423.1 acetyl-CoA C-acyltransferase [Dethiobacter alkaliphilus]
MKEAVIVAAVRTPVGRAKRGGLKDTRPDDLAALVLQEVIKRSGVPAEKIDDIILGCAFPEAEQGMNVGRIAAQIAKLPAEVSGMTVNRFCSSGLESIALAAAKIGMGMADVVIAGGVESMSAVPMGGNKMAANPTLMNDYPQAYMNMGLTAERVAERYNISREDQDQFAERSHSLAEEAIKSGKFNDEIVPVPVKKKYFNSKGRLVVEEGTFTMDDGVRPGTTAEKLAKLRPAFMQGGSVTAGNSSQTSDGAAAVLVMSREKAEELGVKPIAVFRGYAVGGVEADVMGIGPVAAIPKVLAQTGLTKDDLDVIELNEAFAAQALAVVRTLELDPEKVNVNGGAIALGHPLGCTGSKLTVTLLSEMERRNARYGLVSMCIGGGMGAAGIIERL